MSSFKSKAQLLKQHLSREENQQQAQQIQIIKQCRPNTSKQELSLQQPIIIEKKTIVKSQSQTFRKQTNNLQQETIVRKKVEPWVPINIPVRQKKVDLENISLNAPQSQGNKQIQIQIEKDDKNKDCLKKLFKKVKKLEDQLKQSDKQRVRLNLQLENYKNRSKICNDHDRIIAKQEAENYRLSVDLDMTKKLLKDREDEIQRLMQRAPKEIIKEVIVEKPVQVIVEIIKPVPGPERIVEKIVQIPKYIEVQKKVPVEVIKEVPREVIKTVTVQVPTIVQKPVYIDRPVYIEQPPIQRQKIVEVPVRIEVPVEVPVEYPVYIEKPIVQEEWLLKIKQLETHLQNSSRENAYLSAQNNQLMIKVNQLAHNLETLRLHNEAKNRQVQSLLQNSMDYMPYSPNPHQDYSIGSVKYSISSNPHPRVI